MKNAQRTKRLLALCFGEYGLSHTALSGSWRLGAAVSTDNTEVPARTAIVIGMSAFLLYFFLSL